MYLVTGCVIHEKLPYEREHILQFSYIYEQLGFSYSNREIGNSSECIVAKLATPF